MTHLIITLAAGPWIIAALAFGPAYVRLWLNTRREQRKQRPHYRADRAGVSGSHGASNYIVTGAE